MRMDLRPGQVKMEHKQLCAVVLTVEIRRLVHALLASCIYGVS